MNVRPLLHLELSQDGLWEYVFIYIRHLLNFGKVGSLLHVLSNRPLQEIPFLKLSTYQHALGP